VLLLNPEAVNLLSASGRGQNLSDVRGALAQHQRRADMDRHQRVFMPLAPQILRIARHASPAHRGSGFVQRHLPALHYPALRQGQPIIIARTPCNDRPVIVGIAENAQSATQVPAVTTRQMLPS